MLSDDSTSDSDTGIRFKTDTTRILPNKNDNDLLKNRSRNNYKSGDSERSRDRHCRRDFSRERDRSPNRSDRNSRSRNSDLNRYRSFDYTRSRDRDGSDRKSYKTRFDDKSRSPNRSNDKQDKYSSKLKKNDDESKNYEQKLDNNDVNIDRRKPENYTRNNNDVVINIRNTIKRHLDQTSLLNDHKGTIKEKHNENSEKNSDSNSKSLKNEYESRKKYDSTNNDKKYLDNVSDLETKHTSYYNLIENNIGINYNNELRNECNNEDQQYLTKFDKKMKNKKKSKHKEKKKHKKSKSQKCDDKIDINYYTNEIKKVISKDYEKEASINLQQKRKQSDESNEEGEIISDSDECLDVKKHSSIQKNHKSQLPDLRETLLMKSNIMGSAPSQIQTDSYSDDEIYEVEGPALPPHLVKSSNDNSEKYIGPSISESDRKILENNQQQKSPEYSDEEGDIYGPVPKGSQNLSQSHMNLEKRAIKLKMDFIDDHSTAKDKKSREEWMLKLPEGKKLQLGLSARTFRAREGPDMNDRSCWTDTPQEKTMKEMGIDLNEFDTVKLEKNAELNYIKQRDEEQETFIKKHKKKNKRDESLLEIHQKKIKKLKKKEGKEKLVRRPFDRDVDLKVNRFDEAQKKSIIKKSQLLDSRFSQGESKFL